AARRLDGVDHEVRVASFHEVARHAGGDAVISEKVGAVVLRELARRRVETATPEQLASLTPDERRVIASLCSGLTASGAMAEALHISIHTVRMHLNSAQSKAGVADRTQLAVWAARNGLG
ncbi:MAG: LuxR family transcriptional regulator, partial [Microbacterium sp.]